MTTPVPWFPDALYLEGELVVDDEADVAINDTQRIKHPELGGVFRALHDLRAGLLNPRYAVVDVPGHWERCATIHPPERPGGHV